jgi:hypothetical protein
MFESLLIEKILFGRQQIKTKDFDFISISIRYCY